MNQYEVTMSTMTDRYSIKIWADNKTKATYKAFIIWAERVLERNCSFGTFIKCFFEKTEKVI